MPHNQPTWQTAKPAACAGVCGCVWVATCTIVHNCVSPIRRACTLQINADYQPRLSARRVEHGRGGKRWEKKSRNQRCCNAAWDKLQLYVFFILSGRELIKTQTKVTSITKLQDGQTDEGRGCFRGVHSAEMAAPLHLSLSFSSTLAQVLQDG